MEEETEKFEELRVKSFDAILFIFSAYLRLTVDDLAVVENLYRMFGENVTDYMIVVFTGGDQLEERGLTFTKYLSFGEESATQDELQVSTSLQLLWAFSRFFSDRVILLAETGAEVQWQSCPVWQQDKELTEAVESKERAFVHGWGAQEEKRRAANRHENN